MDRRQFLKDAARTLLVLPFGTFLFCCGFEGRGGGPRTTTAPTEPDTTPPDAPPRVSGANVIYTSSRVNLHSHSFAIPSAAFSRPPISGVSGHTTEVQEHSHALFVTAEFLRRAASGQVRVLTAEALGHRHVFTIMRVGRS